VLTSFEIILFTVDMDIRNIALIVVFAVYVYVVEPRKATMYPGISAMYPIFDIVHTQTG